MNALRQILDPVSVDDFVRDYFHRQPLLVRGADDKFEHLFRTEDFKEHLDQVEDIRAVFPLLRQARIGITEIPDMLRAGASICVTGLEQAHDPLRRMVAEMKETLNYMGKISVRSYLSPRGRGFDMHFDARVASTLQIAGQKRWWYAVDPATRYPRKNSPHTEYLRDEGFDPPEKGEMESTLLSPGDFLCIPAGAWHCAEAIEDSLSLNLAFDHANAGFGDCVLAYLKAKIDSVDEYRRPMFSTTPTPWTDPEIVEGVTAVIDDLSVLLAQLSSLGTDILLQQWFERRR